MSAEFHLIWTLKWLYWIFGLSQWLVNELVAPMILAAVKKCIQYAPLGLPNLWFYLLFRVWLTSVLLPVSKVAIVILNVTTYLNPWPCLFYDYLSLFHYSRSWELIGWLHLILQGAIIAPVYFLKKKNRNSG